MKHLLFLLAILLLVGTFQGCTVLLQPSPGDAALSRSSIDFADPVLNERRILLFGDISERAAEETIQKLFYLDEQKEAPIDLYLMTPGGELKAAMSIENAMRLIRSRVNTYALSECNSGGAMLLAAGTGERVAFRGAIIVMHGIKVVNGPPPKEYFNGVQAYYTAFWQQRARLPAQWLPIPPNALHFLTAEQALEYGLIDKIIDRRPTIAELGTVPKASGSFSSPTSSIPAAASAP